MTTDNQGEYGLPIPGNNARFSASLLPTYYRTDSNKKFLQATLNQLTQPGTVKKIDGFIGRQNAKSTNGNDVFLAASDQTRQNYQLEPAAVIKDYIGNVTFYKDYIDHINNIDTFGGNVSNHERLNKQEFYSWDPHIDWDKFVNFQQYYWLPFGPTPIIVAGQQIAIDSTYTVNLVDQGGNYAYTFSNDGLTPNPTITLYRGQTYRFNITSPNNPFSIKTIRSADTLNRFVNDGLINNSISQGQIIFTVPHTAPSVLFYVSETDADTGGAFHILDIDNNSYLNVETDILNKQKYTLGNGTPLTNGMKLDFIGKVTPEKYSNGYWYVEGVGSSIRLISEADTEIVSAYSSETSTLFDSTPFDQEPFSSSASAANTKDYITIARGSPDKNPWSRYNRWFHQSVITAIASATGQVPEFDQAARAKRPIIEFQAGLKLFNFGHQCKTDIDVIDTVTTDAFSGVEGSLGYLVDGVPLTNGMRVLFSADTDGRVKNKIYKVNFLTIQDPAKISEFDASQIDIDKNIINFSVGSPHGFVTGTQVIYLNNANSDISGLLNRKSYYVYVISNTAIKLYLNKSLTAPVDLLKIGAGTHQLSDQTGQLRQINLVEEADATPKLNETVLVRQGTTNQGNMYWFDGTAWKLGPVKLKVNQFPLFDVVDTNGISYGDTTVYPGSKFVGTKLFSYKPSLSSLIDTELGFALSYQNINNVGDISFTFDLLNDSFEYKTNTQVSIKNTNTGFLKLITNLITFNYVNGWKKSLVDRIQPVVRIFKQSNLINNFPVDVYNNVNTLTDLVIRVYVNGHRLDQNKFSIVTTASIKLIRLNTDVTLTDVVTLKCFSASSKNQNGYYEIPINLQNNPLNDNLINFTLGEVINHVDSIIDNITGFVGAYPGNSNLRDLGDLTPYGTKFVQHSGSVNLSLYHLGNQQANVFKALSTAKDDYAKFKRAFLIAANESGIDTEVKQHVDHVLSIVTANIPKTQSYYLSDMFAYSGSVRSEYIVLDARIKKYPLTETFDLTKLSNQTVNIYYNGMQLLHGKDYTFGSDVFFELHIELTEGGIIEAYEYHSTDGSFCPATPTKLGLYPKFEPKIYVDNTYRTPRKVIQGHDGSITIAFNDFRDDLLLELEKRIYNNIKVNYDSDIFDIYEFIPGYDRTTNYSKKEFEQVLAIFFYQWTQLIAQDYTKQTDYNGSDPFTFNYASSYSPRGTNIPAYWRGIYKWFLDTDRPNVTPWETLGFSEEPKWWTKVYGPAPYTSGNLLLWEDIQNGIIREPNKVVRQDARFIRTILNNGLPVDEQGNLLNPLDTNFIDGYFSTAISSNYVFGDYSPVESAWRKSSYYPFALMQTALLLKPNKVLGTCFDRSRIVKNLAGQFVYSKTGLRIRLADIELPSTVLSTSRVFTAGLVNYIVDYMSGETTTLVDQYMADLQSLTNQLGSKLGGFTSKPKFNLLLDSKNPASTGGVFVPQENYNIFLNTSSPVQKLIYSGVIITKGADGTSFEISGYTNEHPYFKYYSYQLEGQLTNIAGLSESYVTWSENQYYLVGTVVRYGSAYYRVTSTHTSLTAFNTGLFAKLSGLPNTGGVDFYIRDTWDKTTENVLSYGAQLSSIQSVVDFLLGYGEYLKDQGFTFDNFNNNLTTVNNWTNAANEFVFWTTQGWAGGTVLSLSPAASQLTLITEFTTVNDINDAFYGYHIFRVDGQMLDLHLTNIYRNDSGFVLASSNTQHGIYGAVIFLVQKEHVLLLDNRTMFNDVIYNLEPGYRQEKVKVLGYITKNWNGSFNIPGFIFDQAKISDWAPYTDYHLGDIVKYKSFYYSATVSLPGANKFNDKQWVKLTKQPTPQLLPNWDYKVEQFTDFYNLNSGNFDVQQQKFAQHLIGYQPRQYLANIIQDDVSQYKFYQGMIIEKGTQNVLNKLFDVLSTDHMESLTFNEEWAVRVGEYGAVDTFDEIEFILDETEFKINPQPFELVNRVDPALLDFVYRQIPTDVYIKPVGYNNNPWPVSNKDGYLRTPGYVRYDDVNYSIDSLTGLKNNIFSQNITAFNDGDYVWCAFESANWNVYRFTRNDFKILDVTYSNEVLSIVCNRIPNVSQGDIIGIKNTKALNRFYRIDSITNATININATVEGFTHTEFLVKDLSQITSYKFIKSRVDSIDNANTVLPKSIKLNELLWADNNGLGQWTVYKNNPVYNENLVTNLSPSTGLNYGKKIAVSLNGNTIAVADNNKISLSSKNIDGTWDNYTNIITTIATGDIAFSPDSNILAYSNPTTNTVTIISIGSVSFNITTVLTPPNNILANDQFGSKLAFSQYSVGAATTYMLAVSSVGYNSSQGQVDIYTSSNTTWTHTQTLSAVTFAGDQFGYSVSATKTGDILVVGAPGSDQNSFAGLQGEYQFGTLYTANQVVVNAGNYFKALHTTTDAPPNANWTLLSNQNYPNTGRIFLYQYDGASYSLMSTIGGQQVPTIDDGDRFGESVSLSTTGAYLAVGSPLSSLTSVSDGKVNIFNKLIDSNFTYDLLQTISSPKDEENEHYGAFVSFIDSSNSLVVLSANGNISNDTMFDTGMTTFDSKSLKFIDRLIQSGRVDIFDRYNTKFIYAESFSGIVSNDALPISTRYGMSVAVGNNTVIVGAPQEEDKVVVNSGLVYSYTKNAGSKTWSVYHKQIDRINLDKIKKVFLYNKKSNQIVTYLDIVEPIQGHIPGVADQEIRYKTYYDPAVYSYTDKTVSGANIDNGANWLADKVGVLWWDLTRAKFIENVDGDIVYRSTNWNKLYNSASIDVYEWVSSRLKPSQWDARADTEAGLAVNISGKSLYGDAVYSTSQRYDSVSEVLITTYYFWVRNKQIVPNALGRSLSAAEVSSLITDPTAYGYSCLALTGTNSFNLVNCKKYLKSTDIALHVEYWTVDNQELNLHTEWKIISEDIDTELPAQIETKWFHSLSGRDANDETVPNLSLPVKQRYGVQFRPRQGMFINRLEALKQFITRTNTVLAKVLISDSHDITSLSKYESAPSYITGKWDITISLGAELQYIGTSNLSQASATATVVKGVITEVSFTNKGFGYINAPFVTVTGTGNGAVIKTTLDNLGRINGYTILDGGEGYNTLTTSLSIRPYSVLVTSDAFVFDKWAILQWNAGTKSWARVKSQSYDVTKFWKYIDWYATGYNQFTKIDYIVDNTYFLSSLTSNIGDVVKVKNIGTGGWILLQKYSNTVTIDYTQNYTVVGRYNGTIEFSSSLYDYANTVLGFDDQLYDGATYDDFASIELNIILDTIKHKLLINELRLEYLKLFFASLRYVMYEQSFVDWAFKTSFVKARHNVGMLKQKVTYNNDNLKNFEDYVNEVKPYRTKIREYVSAYDSIDYAKHAVSDFDLLPVIDSTQQIHPIAVSVSDQGIVEYDSAVINTYPWKMWLENVGFKINSIKIVDGGSGYISEPVVKILDGYGQNAVAKAYIAGGKVNRIDLVNQGTGYLKAPQIVLAGGLGIRGVAARAVAIIESEVVRTSKLAIKFDRISKSYYSSTLLHTDIFTGTGSRLQFSLTWSPKTEITIYQRVTVDGIEVLKNEYSLSNTSTTANGTTKYFGILKLDSAPAKGAKIVVDYEKDFNHLSATDRINFYYNPAAGEIAKDLSQLMTGVDYAGVNISGLDFHIAGGWDNDAGWASDQWDSYTNNRASDSSITPDADSYDTSLDGGRFIGTVLSTAIGVNPDDINVDGDGFVTPMTSHAPEEVVPGQILDSLAIKVYTRPSSGNSTIFFKNYLADGVGATYSIAQKLLLNHSIIVKVGTTIIEAGDYQIDMNTNLVTLVNVPTANSVVSIISFGPSSTNLLDIDYFVSDGTTNEFVTRAPWLEDNLNATVLVDGVIVNYVLFKTDNTYASNNRTAIRFGTIPTNGSIVTYIINVNDSTSSIVKSQSIITNGTDYTYSLDNLTSSVLSTPGLLPYETNVLVRAGSTVLKPPTAFYHILADNQLEYTIPTYQFAPYNLAVTDIRVFVNGIKLNFGADFTVNSDTISVVLVPSSYINNAKLTIVVDANDDYRINDNGTITFKNLHAQDTAIDVTTFYNHSILDIKRTTDTMIPATTLVPDTSEYFEFTAKTGGKFKLADKVVAEDRVWVIKNNQLLTLNVDYIILSDYKTIQLTSTLVITDVIQVIAFNGIPIKENSFGFMQFKDILNRTHYKRLNAASSTTLREAVKQTSADIAVVDGSVLTTPNPTLNLPGVVFINGERIEYFYKLGNVISQLRRGTLGTGVPTIHAVNSLVQDVSSGETVPYTDSELVETFIADGTGTTVTPTFNIDNINEIEVFVGGYRLKKSAYTVYSETLGYPYSPAGDIILPPEFTVNNSIVSLRTPPAANTKIILVKKQGQLWGEMDQSLRNSNSIVANFVKKSTTIWPR